MILRHRSDRFYPFAFGILLAVWGLWLLLPGSSYDVNHGFDYIRDYISEPALGVLAAVLGVVQVSSVFLRRTKIIAFVGHISFYFWLLLALSFVKGDWHAANVVIYGWLALMNGLGYINWKLNQEEDSLVD